MKRLKEKENPNGQSLEVMNFMVQEKNGPTL